jgi:polygalacturonase
MNNESKRSWFLVLVCVLSLSAFAATKAPNGGWEQLPGILKNIKTPTFPDRDFDITQFGAKADGKTDCTEAIKKAIAKCHEAGGGRVLVPAGGTYYTGPIHLKSNVHLEVSKGAALLFSDNFMDYLPPVLIRWEGEECYSLSPLIYANNCENIAVTGRGILQGNGETWWNWRKSEGEPYRAANNVKKEWSQSKKPVAERILAKKNFHWCPTFISPYNSKSILIDGLTLIDGPFWNVHPVYCRSVIVRNLTIRNQGPNGDGCNPDSCQYVLIEGCLFDTGDDCIAIKSGKNEDGRRVNRPSEYIVVRNCTMKEGHGGVVMGSEMTGGVRSVYAEDCEMDSPNLDRALRIKTNSVRGGTVENVYMRNVKVGQVADAVFKVNFLYGEKDTGAFTPTVRNINMENVICNKSKYGVRIDAYERSPVSGLHLKNCRFMDVHEGNILNHVKDVKVDNVKINGKLVDDNLEGR